MKTEITQLLTPQTHDFNGRTANGINGRALHQGLGVGRMYAHWIKARIQQERFIENLDYLIVQDVAVSLPNLASSNNKQSSMARTQKGNEYIISLDCIGLTNCNNSKTVFDKLSQNGEQQNG